MEFQMVEEQKLGQMGKSKLENTRMGGFMVKEHSLNLMEKSM